MYAWTAAWVACSEAAWRSNPKGLRSICPTASGPAANAVKSAQPFCDQVTARAGAEGELRGYRSWIWRAEYPFYLRRPLPVLHSEEELASYWSRREEVFLIIEDQKLEEARTVIGEGPPLIDHRIGHKQVYLFSNRRSD